MKIIKAGYEILTNLDGLEILKHIERIGRVCYKSEDKITEKRLYDTIRAGFVPYAMLWKNNDGETDPEWKKFQGEWVRPQIVGLKLKEIWG